MKTTKELRYRRIIWAVVIAVCLCVGILFAYVLLRRAPIYHRAYNKGVLELRNRNPEKALEYFRRSVQANPEFLDARRSVIRTLMRAREYDKAESEIVSALEAGLLESEATYFRAQIKMERARQRLETVGEKATADIYAGIIEEEIDPAIEDLLARVDTIENAAQAYTLLGELLEQKGSMLTLRELALYAERQTAVRLEDPTKVATKDFEIAKTRSELRSARLDSIDALNKAIELDPGFVRPRLSAASYAIDRYVPQPDVARKLIAPLLEKDPPNPEAMRILITIERMEGNFETALKHIHALRVKQRRDLPLAIDEIEVLFDLDRWEETVPLIQNLFLIEPDDPRVDYVRGKLLIHQGDFQKAIKPLEKIFLKEALPWPDARLLLADAILKSGMQDQAIPAYEATIKDIDAKRAANIRMFERFRRIRYTCHLNIGRLMAAEDASAAAKHAKHAFDIFRDEEDAYQNVRGAYIAAGYRNEIPGLAVMHIAAVARTQGSEVALDLCREAMRGFENSPPLRMLESSLLMRMGRYTEAMQTIQKLADDFPNDSTYLRALARLHIQLGHVEEARKVYEAILERDPYDSSAISALLGLLTGRGEIDAVRDLLARVEDKLGPQKLRTLYMNLALSEKKPEDAIRLAEAHVHANPFSAPAHELLAMLLWQHGELSPARKAFNNALSLDPAYRIAYRRGLLDIEEGRFQDAIDLFRQAITRMPAFPALRVHLAVAFAANGQIDAAIRTLDEVQETIMTPETENSVVQWFSALMHAAQGDTDQADFYCRRVTATPVISTADRGRLLDRLILLKASDRHAAATALTLADIFANNGCLNSAQAQLIHAQTLLTADPLISCWLAMNHAKQRDSAKAIELLEATVKADPSCTPARLILADTYVQTSDLDQAAETLTAALDVVPESRLPWIHLRLGKIQENLGLYEPAIENYKLAMEDPQYEATACSEAAWLLATAQKKPDEAIPYARRSLELNPGNPAVLDTLGWALFLSGDITPSVENLELAKSRLPSNPTIRFHLAQAYRKAGRSDEAKVELTEALAISDRFPEASEAQSLLDQLQPR